MTPLPRRRFLGHLATVSLAVGLFSRRLGAQAVPEGEILGQGGFRYRIQRDWGKVEGRTVKDCHAMVQDRAGRLYLAQTDNSATSSNILVYDRSGKPVEAWGKDYPGAHGLVISDEGGEEFLYITDTSRRQVIKTTLAGKVVMTLGRPKGGAYANPKAGFTPTDVAVAPNGDLYVMDGYASSLVTRFSSKGEEIAVFGAGQLSQPHGGSVDTRSGSPELRIASRQHRAIKRFGLDGKLLGEVALANGFPCFVTQPRRGAHSYVPLITLNRNCHPEERGCVAVLDADLRVVSLPGAEAPVYKDGALQPMALSANNPFRYPHGVCVDDEESLYVAQWNTHRTFPVKLARV
ncbi:MAG: 6-bladed beta-propeller [Opitutia bacterium]|jgi:sugar lactone lactonase YvrE